MRIELPIRPLSVNQAWAGRRFNTPAKDQFERIVGLLLPKIHIPGPFYRVAYDFHLVYFATTDYDSGIKVLQDCLVKKKIITDDKHIVEARIRKFKADKDSISIEIEGVTL